MREIKFRAWTDKRMYKNVGVVGNIVVLEYKSNEVWGDVDLEPTYYGIRDESIKLMQYTGLKDKNGTEIYEGDITTNELYKGEGVAFVVYYDNEKGMFKQRPFMFKNNGKKLGNKDLMLQMDSVENKEVIGNVYENPKLLEVE